MLEVDIPSLKSSKWYMRIFFWLQNNKYGKVLEPCIAWGIKPLRLFYFLKMWDTFEKNTTFSLNIKTIVCVYVSKLNHCKFCIDLHQGKFHADAKMLQKLANVENFNTSEHFTIAEKVMLEYTRSVCETPVNIDPFIMQKLKSLLSDAEIVELTELIAFQNMSSKLNSALNLKPHGFS